MATRHFADEYLMITLDSVKGAGTINIFYDGSFIKRIIEKIKEFDEKLTLEFKLGIRIE